MIDFYVHGSIKIRDAKKHSQGGILPKSANAVTKKKKKEKRATICILASRSRIS